ncbi:hypothetical protein [Streptomyces sp. NRRL F-525]|uniref:hypothetical protein n=1 Tax=Streptomyces sp. NRRL F-525 TaxID=1463861 RepID=UPI000A53179C|nr:hypothetical protein [Streptomyces sp. NRRL F-525]
MSGTDVLIACQDGELDFGRGTTATAVIVGTDQLIAPTDGRTRETPEVSDVRH